jgi:tetratricopeptide (TPR) repeat protein
MEIRKNPNLATNFSQVKGDKDAAFYYNRGILEYNSGQKDEAERDFIKATEVENDNSIAYFNRGTFYLNEKKYKFAIEDFQKAIRIKARFAEAHYNLACSYVQILSFREALYSLKKAVNLEMRYATRAAHDPDFVNISRMKEFIEITGYV